MHSHILNHLYVYVIILLKRKMCIRDRAVNTLTQRMSYPSCAAEVTVDASALKEGDVAGLCALQGCYAAVGITKRHGKYEVLMLDKKEDGILDKMCIRDRGSGRKRKA